MSLAIWQECLAQLKDELSAGDFSTWLRPLQADFNHSTLSLYSPNKYTSEWVRNKYMATIEDKVQQLVNQENPNHSVKIRLMVGNVSSVEKKPAKQIPTQAPLTNQPWEGESKAHRVPHKSNLIKKYTFDNFVEGKSNNFAIATTQQIAENPGDVYNPLFLYAHPGLGKTHLLHAVGNAILAENPESKVVYIRSERFVQDMINSIRNNTIEQFKEYYASLDALLIDDIHFFAGKDRSQEVLFQTFNSMLDAHQQVILTSDRFPKEIEGIDERLRTRFGWGLSIPIDPPELETRVAILITKAEERGLKLPDDVAFFIAKRLTITDVRVLEGAIANISAKAQFTGQGITISLVQDALRDMLAVHTKQTTIDNIQKIVAQHYRIKISDMSSKRRTRTVARPRQIAMALAKELTQHSLPEIGEAFGGRDHTTVLHACRKVQELRRENNDIQEDYKILIRTLSM
ncbi:chromosomal replication initiator protein DnaA [Psychromonas ingrahamii 37]|uniref:Chromosomal replication initiator protein DnaA n=1 Tax=Psychromonas ingrahamii (strain DSM 17664 / CCUG 51855 / 37) TaxID=357804 RepID=DNAA_PSYIN|nr:chromosomal replication initiator protein DnaA [Psychromonas ingrahamii]A1T0X4.1 RecName: Full=Chromosomal replication initiator protein DnaA [Psychromonas ingrahamii 37]ABM05389.1 chromosomal replication initiator protein DnaA [Psychromonas ingrahamii 37]